MLIFPISPGNVNSKLTGEHVEVIISEPSRSTPFPLARHRSIVIAIATTTTAAAINHYHPSTSLAALLDVLPPAK